MGSQAGDEVGMSGAGVEEERWCWVRCGVGEEGRCEVVELRAEGVELCVLGGERKAVVVEPEFADGC